jgi:hypothetical protein
MKSIEWMPQSKESTLRLYNMLNESPPAVITVGGEKTLIEDANKQVLLNICKGILSHFSILENSQLI